MKFTIGNKLWLGFGLMIALNAAVATLVFFNAQEVNKTQTRVIELRTPTAMAGAELRNGINESLASLRGYMILGTDNWKEQRVSAWVTMDEQMALMKKFSESWTNPENIDRLRQFETVMNEFRVAQELVESVAKTPEEQPAMTILFTEAAPQGKILAENITKMINAEFEFDHSGMLSTAQGVDGSSKQLLDDVLERKELLGMMADVRGTLGLSLGAIRAYLLSGDAVFKDQFDALWAKNARRFGDLQAASSMLTAEQQEAFAVFSDARAKFEPFPAQMFAIRESADWNVANKYLKTEAAPRATMAQSILSEMITDQETLLAADADELATLSSTLIRMVILSSAVACAIGCIIAFLLKRMITKPIGILSERFKDIAGGEGDLTVRVDESSGDEIGELGKWFNVFLGNLNSIISQMRDVSQVVASASTEIAASAEEMAGGLQKQEQQTQQVAAAVEELSQSVNEVAGKSADTTTASEESQRQAEDGGSIVNSTVEEMRAIATEVKSSAETINTLGRKSETIGEIIAVINDIADQTNLLALNAAIEAARAGEHGRGFAVVADEVRKLAERTTEATEEVSQSIRGIQTETKTAVQLIESGSERVGRGVELATQAGTSLRSIVSGSQSVQGMVQDIAAAANEQSAATGEIARAVEGINSITRQSSESASQAAQAAGDLACQAEELQGLVGQFKLE